MHEFLCLHQHFVMFCCETKDVKFGVQETDAEHEMEMKLEMKSLSPGKAAGGFFLVGFFVSFSVSLSQWLA